MWEQAWENGKMQVQNECSKQELNLQPFGQPHLEINLDTLTTEPSSHMVQAETGALCERIFEQQFHFKLAYS